jgi:integrase
VWVGRWLEDELQPDGSVCRVHKSEVLGTQKELPTKRLAQRELDRCLAVVNSHTYKARPTATFCQMVDRWTEKVLPNHAESTQRSEKSDLKAWSAALGELPMKDVNGELLQSIVTSWKNTKSPKTIRNRVATFRLLWDSAKAWDYVLHTPYESLVLPNWTQEEQPCFAIKDVERIFAAAAPPYDVVYWLIFETGIRRGEVCALDVGNIDLENRIIHVRRSRSLNGLKSTKGRKPRVFSLSPQLVDRLRPLVEARDADEPLFLTKRGKRLHPDNFVKRELKPLLEQLGLPGAAHAFRHGNATVLDRLKTPMKVRQERLGHVDPKTTMNYTHLVSEDDRLLAAKLGEFFAQVCLKTETAQEVES